MKSNAHRLEIDVSVRQHHALRIRARSARVKEFGHSIFVELHEVGAIRCGASQKLLVILRLKPIGRGAPSSKTNFSIPGTFFRKEFTSSTNSLPTNRTFTPASLKINASSCGASRIFSGSKIAPASSTP